MKEMNPFETIQSRKRKEGRFTLIEDQVRVNGHVQPYDYLEIKEGVCVLPIYKNRLILQRQYRYPVRSWQWEFPGGFVDAEETPAKAAERELKEETGYKVEKMEALGAFYPSFGSTNEKIYLFYAECKELGETEREPGEIIELKEVPVTEFVKMVAEGEFMHGAGLAAWARYISRYKICEEDM